MEIIFELKNVNKLPTIDELVKFMWYEKANISRVGNDKMFRGGEEISLSWNKWVNDTRWTNHIKSTEYIYIQYVQSTYFKIEVDDSALIVDKRAAALVAKLIIETAETLSNVDKENLLNRIEENNEYYQYSFESAVEVSLKE
ncbi:hypothetical protein [Cohnella abietis]|uniref:Uncharacterized protein n=1 Tax=Cohnella abietis TaxID=2507935 RepID=A0A3T1D5F6_9BACL|nr:hypothetical protein [Cohnella abietis]BBI33334.1 hypothetical protein KCTCHS21_27330 [Cohnella abietis]